MSQRYIITKSSFLEGWTVTSPTWIEDNGYGPTAIAEGKVVDSHEEAVAWMREHAALRWLTYYYSHTAPEPAY